MKLIDLEPEFIRFNELEHEGIIKTCLQEVETLAEAQGVFLDCPVCQRSHSIMIAFADRGVLDHQGTRSTDGRPTRWTVAGGTGLHDLTLTPSIDCTPSNPSCWHGFITNGEVTCC